MSFVRSPAEIERIQRILGEPRFVGGRQLTVEFLTSRETLERLLPPPLRATPEPRVSATIGKWHSNGFGDFAGASIYLAATHEGVPGGYALAMWMDGEPARAFGWEVFGEPKKLATILLGGSGEHHCASIERDGGRLVDLEGVMSEDLEPAERVRIAYNYRSRTAPDGIGLDGPAVLTRATFTERVRRRRRGQGTVSFRDSVHDPLGELEIVSVLGATYSELDIAARCEAIDSVPGEEFLAFHHGRADDWLALDTSESSRVD